MVLRLLSTHYKFLKILGFYHIQFYMKAKINDFENETLNL